MSTFDLSDEEIIHSIKIGDERKLLNFIKELQINFVPYVNNLIIVRWGREQELANEIFQICSLKLIEAVKHGKFDPTRGSINNYFKAILNNTWISYIKAEKRTKLAIRQYNHKFTGIQFYSTSPSSSKEQKLQCIDKMLHRLEKENPSYAWILQQYWLENRSMKDIAAKSGKSYANVRKLHERAKLKARTIFQEILQKETQ